MPPPRSAKKGTPPSRARPPTPTARSSSAADASSSPSPAARALFILLANVIAAGALYHRVSSGEIPFPEPVARFVGDVTVGLGLAEALPGLAAAASPPQQSQQQEQQQQCGLLGEPSFILASSRVVFPDGVRPGALLVTKGKIAAVGPNAEALQPLAARAAAPLLSALGIGGSGSGGSADGDEQPPPAKPFLVQALASLFAPLPVHDYGYSAISPGVIDVHAHLNEPGREEWEGVATGTAAAAAGGVTTLVDMPLNSAPAAVTADLLLDKIRAIEAAGPRVDVALWGGLVPENARDERGLAAMLDAGALGFKSFMCPSGIRDFAHVSVSDVRAALPALMRLGVPYLVHAELVEPEGGEGGAAGPAREGADAPVEPPASPGDKRRRKYATYLATRPASFERDAIGALISALADAQQAASAEKAAAAGKSAGGGGGKAATATAATSPPYPRGFRLHVVHLGDASSVPALAAAKRRLPALSVETCPHYLLFDESHVRDGDTRFKCAPPLRSRGNRLALRDAVASGVVDLVASDHSPAPKSLKAAETGDFISAWGGINGLQYLLPAAWTALRSGGGGEGGGGGGDAAAAAAAGSGGGGGLGLAAMARVLSAAPAALAGLAGRKGALVPGLDADVVVWDPEVQADTTAAANRHKHGADTSPYSSGGGGGGGNAGRALRGRVLATFVRGSLVFDGRRPVGQDVAQGEGTGTCGQLVLRPKKRRGGSAGA